MEIYQRTIAEEYGLSKSAVGRIGLSPDKYIYAEIGDQDRKRILQSKENVEINELIYQKIKGMREKSITITQGMIVAIGKQIQEDILSMNTCMFSNTWFKCFKQFFNNFLTLEEVNWVDLLI